MNLTIQAALNVIPSKHYRNDSMNVNNYLNYLKFPMEDNSMTRFVSGIAF
jgi:hypothetical protein